MVTHKYSKMTWQERKKVREKYVEHQKVLCYYCNRSLRESPVHNREINWQLFPSGKDFLKHPIHLHHCHKTDLTLGAVHSYCNAYLFQYLGE